MLKSWSWVIDGEITFYDATNEPTIGVVTFGPTDLEYRPMIIDTRITNNAIKASHEPKLWAM